MTNQTFHARVSVTLSNGVPELPMIRAHQTNPPTETRPLPGRMPPRHAAFPGRGLGPGEEATEKVPVEGVGLVGADHAHVGDAVVQRHADAVVKGLSSHISPPVFP